MRKRAFTLIELLVAMTIVSILASVVILNVGNSKDKALNARRASDMDAIYKALKLYYTDNKNTVPPGVSFGSTCLIGVNAEDTDCLKELVDGKYMDSLPLGPTGKCAYDTGDPEGFASGESCYLYHPSFLINGKLHAVIFTKMVPEKSGPLGACSLDGTEWYCLGFPIQ